MSHDRNDRRSRNVVRGGADFNGIQHDALFKRHKISFRVEIFGDLLGHFFVERLVDGCENAAVHQFSLEVFCENAQFFGEIFNRQTFRQCDFAEFAWRFRFGLRPDIRRFQLLFRLAFVALRTIHAFVYRRAALLNHRRRRHRWSPGAIPRTCSCRGAWRCRAALESRCGRMSRLSLWRTHRPLTGAIKRSPLARRRRWRQPMLLPEPLLHDLLHRLSLLMRRLDSGRYGRTNSCWRGNDSATARRGLYCRRGWRLYLRRNNGRRRSYGRGSHRQRRSCGRWRDLCRRRRSLLFGLGFWFGFNERRCCDDLLNRLWPRSFWRGRRDFDLRGFDDFRQGFRLRLLGGIDTELPPQPFGQAVLDRVGVRRYRHTHVL